MPVSLKLKRASTLAELHRHTFEVVVDGKVVATIDMHESIEVPVEPGRHTLQVRLGRYSSRTETFEVADGGEVAFRCSGARIWPVWLATFLISNRALTLHRE